jgi:hypothetical protein
VGRGPEMASAAGRLLLPPGLGKSDRLLWQVPEQVWGLWKNGELVSKDIHVLMSAFTSNHLKKREPYFPTSPRNTSAVWPVIA